ncbi:unnamed protein product [Mytilus coruscus]|uniref:Uncharacterized protein n=1 Tax=Mytilus coruscus TaxID=42192 RepID=A0A6J8EKY7_MYTCO|nr:unnamed protein product [Mytilus coruscus]
MIEMQMMQNMSMNNMLANQQMQFMMQQQQMIQQHQMLQQQQMMHRQQFIQQPPFQQSSLQPSHGFSMYPHMSIPRHVPPPPGFVPNIIPNVPVGINHHPLQYQQPIFTHYGAPQNAYQQHMHQSVQYQPIQRDKCPKNQASQCSNVYQSSTQEAPVRTNCLNHPSGTPLFVLPGDIPCNKTSDNINLQENQQQALPTSNYSPNDDMSTAKTIQNCLSTPVRATSHQANSDKSFLGVDQINPPPDPSIVRIAQSQQN